MWRISYKTMSLQDVLIMAYMNVLQARLREGLYSWSSSELWRQPQYDCRLGTTRNEGSGKR